MFRWRSTPADHPPRYGAIGDLSLIKQWYHPGEELFESIFQGRSNDEIFNLLSEGIRILLEHSECLVNDAKLLKNNDRYMLASFLSVTAREEMAKVDIFTDA